MSRHSYGGAFGPIMNSTSTGFDGSEISIITVPPVTPAHYAHH
jgi:hypothetical protein